MLKRRFLTSSILWLTILDFSKGVNPWFWVKISKSLIHRFSSKSSRENFSVILKSAINDEKARFFWGGGGWPYWILPNGLTHDFGAKLKSLFFIVFLSKLSRKRCFTKIKTAEIAGKTCFWQVQFWKWPYYIFQKGLTHDFGSKFESLLLISFVLNRVEKIFWRY